MIVRFYSVEMLFFGGVALQAFSGVHVIKICYICKSKAQSDIELQSYACIRHGGHLHGMVSNESSSKLEVAPVEVALTLGGRDMRR